MIGMMVDADCTPMRFAWQLRSKQWTENGLGLRSFIFPNDFTFHSDIDVSFQYVSESYISSILHMSYGTCGTLACCLVARSRASARKVLPSYNRAVHGTPLGRKISQDADGCRWPVDAQYFLGSNYSILFDASREHHELGIDNVLFLGYCPKLAPELIALYSFLKLNWFESIWTEQSWFHVFAVALCGSCLCTWSDQGHGDGTSEIQSGGVWKCLETVVILLDIEGRQVALRLNTADTSFGCEKGPASSLGMWAKISRTWMKRTVEMC